MTKEISIRVRVSRAIWDASKDPNRSTTSRAGDAITAFLEAAAEQGWHMRPDEATEEMVKQMRGFIWNIDRGPTVYRATNAAAPKFEWDK